MKRLFKFAKHGKGFDEESLNRFKRPLLRAANNASGLNFQYDKEYYKREVMEARSDFLIDKIDKYTMHFIPNVKPSRT